MATDIDPPIRGYWTLRDFPEVVFVGRARFRKAGFQQSYPGVIAQYREDVEQNSRHLKVMTDGTWRIDHVDDDNPDRGRPLQHFFSDHPVGQMAAVGLGIGALFVLGRALLRG